MDARVHALASAMAMPDLPVPVGASMKMWWIAGSARSSWSLVRHSVCCGLMDGKGKLVNKSKCISSGFVIVVVLVVMFVFVFVFM